MRGKMTERGHVLSNQSRADMTDPSLIADLREIEDEIDEKRLSEILLDQESELSDIEREVLELTVMSDHPSSDFVLATILSSLNKEAKKITPDKVYEIRSQALEKLRSSKTLKDFLGIEDDGITT